MFALREAGAFGSGEVGFADGAIHFLGLRWRFEAIGEQKALQRETGGPERLERGDVFGLQFEEFAFCFENPRVGGQHFGVAVEHQAVGFLGKRKYVVAILLGGKVRVGVFVESRGSAFAQREANAKFFRCGAVNVGAGGGDIALIAIEERKLHTELRIPLPASSKKRIVERFTVVVETSAGNEVGNFLALGAREFGLGAIRGSGSNAIGGTLRSDGFDLMFVEFRPAVFEIAGHGLQREIWLPEH